jgi:hypothetical protein
MVGLALEEDEIGRYEQLVDEDDREMIQCTSAAAVDVMPTQWLTPCCCVGQVVDQRPAQELRMMV